MQNGSTLRAPTVHRASTPVLLVMICGAGCNAYDRDLYYASVYGISDASHDAGTEAVDAVAADAPAMDAPIHDAPVIDVPPVDVPTPTDSPNPTDGGPPPTDAPATNCAAHASALFCDGFESSTFIAGGWSGPSSTTSNATRSTTMPYRGVGSMRGTTNAPGDAASVFWSALGGGTSGDVYVRGYFYFPTGYSFDQIGVIALLPSTPADNVSLMVSGGGQLAAWSGAGMHFVNGNPSGIVPRDRWVCLEFHVALSTTTTGSIEFFMDGILAGGGTGFATTTTTGHGTVEIGITYTSPAQAASTVYLDEVVIDHTRIGCD